MITHDHDQNTQEWMTARCGLPTASSAKLLVTSTGAASKSMTAYAEKLAGDTFAGHDIDAWEGNAFTDRGHEIEGEARSWYEFETSNDVNQVGFCTDDEGKYGASPDGLIGDDGLIEIKCLPRQHIKPLLYIHKNSKPPTDYLQQCHMQMLVTGRAWCDLVYYHPDLPKMVMRIARDYDFDKALLTQIDNCVAHRNITLRILQEIAG